MYKQAVTKIRENHAFQIRETIDKSDLKAITDIADLTFKIALTDDDIYKGLKTLFKNSTINVKPKKIGDDYDYIMQGSVSFDDIDEAADFLAGCKLFIKYSSEYSLCVGNCNYIFHFNVDRIDGDVYSD